MKLAVFFGAVRAPLLKEGFGNVMESYVACKEIGVGVVWCAAVEVPRGGRHCKTGLLSVSVRGREEGTRKTRMSKVKRISQCFVTCGLGGGAAPMVLEPWTLLVWCWLYVHAQLNG